MSSWFIALVITAQCINIGYTQITPSQSNSTHEYFVASKDTDSWGARMIQCTAPYCHVSCDEVTACYTTVIDAALSDVLTVECSEPSSCAYTNVLGPNATLEVHCTQHSSCHDTYIKALSTSNVNIFCDSDTATTEGACFKLIMNYDDGTIANTGPRTSVHCIGQYSCEQSHLYCESAEQCNIDCTATHACTDANVYIGNKYNGLDIHLNCTSIYSTSCNETTINSCSDACSLYGCCSISEGDITCSNSECQVIDDTLSNRLTMGCMTDSCDGPLVQFISSGTTSTPTDKATTNAPTTSNPTTAIPTANEPSTTSNPITAIPTTNEPSLSIVNEPTISPSLSVATSNDPTVSVSNEATNNVPTKTPSFSNDPTKSPSLIATTSVSKTKESTASAISTTKKGRIIKSVVIAVVVFVLFAVFIALFVHYKTRKAQDIQGVEMNTSLLENDTLL